MSDQYLPGLHHGRFEPIKGGKLGQKRESYVNPPVHHIALLNWLLCKSAERRKKGGMTESLRI